MHLKLAYWERWYIVVRLPDGHCPKFRTGQYRDDDHLEDAAHFSLNLLDVAPELSDGPLHFHITTLTQN